jgi:hypothetical protein
MVSDDHKIYEQYLLTELFDSKYQVNSIIAEAQNSRKIKFENFDQLFAFQLRNQKEDPISSIKCYFLNRNNNKIELIIHPTISDKSIFEDNIHETFVVLFHDAEDVLRMKLNSNDASTVAATVMYILLDFLVSYKKLIERTTNDWDTRMQHGIFKFKPHTNNTMNTVSKQIRSMKEKNRGISQRSNLYIQAFKKILNPKFPELNIGYSNDNMIVKS